MNVFQTEKEQFMVEYRLDTVRQRDKHKIVLDKVIRIVFKMFHYLN